MALVDSFDAVVFDYGGVLVSHQTGADQARMAALLNVPAESFTETYWIHRAEYDKADLSAAEYWHDVAKVTGAALSPELLSQLIEVDTETWMRFDEIVWLWIAQLRKANKRVAMLSNMPRELGEALRARTTRLDIFDQVTLSCEVRAAKPEPVIYEHCLEALDVAPERMLFLDDRMENVHGAELLGIRAIQFLDRDDVLLRVRD